MRPAAEAVRVHQLRAFRKAVSVSVPLRLLRGRERQPVHADVAGLTIERETPPEHPNDRLPAESVRDILIISSANQEPFLDPINPNPAAFSIDFDHPPVAEIEVEGARYRVDAGLGTAVAVSQRAPGSWSWQLLAEG